MITSRLPITGLPQRAHNEYLELLAGGGIIGAVLGVWFVFIVVRESRNRLHDFDPFRRSVCLGALVGLVGVAIHSLVDFGLHVTVNALVCCVLITIGATKIRSGLQHGRRRSSMTSTQICEFRITCEELFGGIKWVRNRRK